MLAVVDPLHALDVAGLVAALGAGDDGQVLLLGLLGGGQDLADAGAVDGDGLLGEDVLARLDRPPRCASGGSPGGVARMTRSTPLVDHLLVGVEADEAAVVGDVDLVAELASSTGSTAQCSRWSSNMSPMAWSLTFGRRTCIDCSAAPRAPAAAADQADLDRVAAGGVDVRERAETGRGRGGDGRGLEEVARDAAVALAGVGSVMGGILRNGGRRSIDHTRGNA